MKVVLVARNEEKLQAVAKEIKETYEGAETKTIVFDFNQNYTSEVIKELTEKFDEIENRRGKNFREMNDTKIYNMININVTATAVITKIFIPKLLANETRAGMVIVRGYLCNFPCPTMSVYSATKAYVTQFSPSKREEYKHKIDVLLINTGSVKNNMNIERQLCTIIPSQYAKTVLDKLGYDSWTSGHYMHAIRQCYLHKPIEEDTSNASEKENQQKRLKS
ncbi:unnamed protein product [Moneuplotes crassus]|uniref:Sepiapterin reductase n=1 Tax=Euplotes crassus TaxID=5936 RepID=A0AAD1XLP2_EUPCR|nr:unnamed protein product [Moneuplotes crassus]